MTRFSVTWDYRCPFARNAHEHVVVALRGGAPYEVEFVPFSLSQMHVQEGEPDVWGDPAQASGLLATETAIAVRRLFPEKFLDTHLALFAARHDRGLDIRERDVVRQVVDEVGVPADAVFAEVDGGAPHEEFRKAHDAAVAEHQVFGVPTFIIEAGAYRGGGELGVGAPIRKAAGAAGDHPSLPASASAVFVRIMTRPGGDEAVARVTIDKVLALVAGSPEINEFKHTTIPR